MKQNPQQKFTPTRLSLPISLLRTRELIMKDLRSMLARHDITEQQWRVLRVVHELEESDATTIAKRACILAPSLTRIMRNLAKRGLLKNVRDLSDGRRSVVRLSDEGVHLLNKVSPEGQQVFRQLRDIVGDNRWDELVKLLGEIRDDINKANESKLR